ncbi:MAG: Holliday junction branch migration protein RuvA [Magnetospirillum sp.]|nr:Holliday junction branch migration protein RuvA [Magnetospirillum sp.]
MIAKLKGLVDALGEDWAVIDVGGVGYHVACSARTLSRLEAGAAVAVFVDTWVREDAIQLYGFLDAGEREWFRLLTTVQGVGPKVGLAILSVASPEQLLQTIAAQDRTTLTRAAGVGPKLAARILAELKDKAGRIALGGFAPAAASAVPAPAVPAAAGGVIEDAVSALVNLGYRRLEAFEAVGAASRDTGEGADAGALIRAALKRLGREMAR